MKSNLEGSRSIEHLTSNQGIVGSSPIGRAKLCYPFLGVNTFDMRAAIGIKGSVT